MYRAYFVIFLQSDPNNQDEINKEKYRIFNEVILLLRYRSMTIAVSDQILLLRTGKPLANNSNSVS